MKHDPSSFTLAIGDGANDVNMIQSASIGVGVMGREGNQAATFSDYAIPSFGALHRLMFWHGRHFGTKAVIFLNVALFKSQLFMVPMLTTNMTNGFSGVAMYADTYYAMFDILNTVWVLMAFLLLDQDVAFNTERYKSDLEPLNDTQTMDEQPLPYDPNAVEPMRDLMKKDIFDREKLVTSKGIKLNSDGSTNNLAEYTWYSRNTLMKKFRKNYVFFFIWAYISGAISYIVCSYALGGILKADGLVNDYWNIGVCILFSNVVSNHVMMVNETRNYTWFLVVFYLFSIGCLFLVVNMNDGAAASVFYKDHWTYYFRTPLFYLTLFLLVFIIVMPRRIIIIIEHVFARPEFNHVRG